MRAQEVQSPLILDADWLAVGHVDEFVQFVPANTTRGWAVVIDDPEAGLELLRGVQRKGLGSARAFSRASDPGAVPPPLTRPLPGGPSPNDTSSGGGEDSGNTTYAVPQLSVDELLAEKAMIDANTACARRISANIAILKEATGVTDEEIYRLPAVFSNVLGNGTGEESLKAGAYYPGMINGIVLSETDYLSPKPWGPWSTAGTSLRRRPPLFTPRLAWPSRLWMIGIRTTTAGARSTAERIRFARPTNIGGEGNWHVLSFVV